MMPMLAHSLVPAAAPALPKSIFSEFGRSLRAASLTEASQILKLLADKDDSRDNMFRSIRSVLRNNTNILFATRTGMTDDLQPLIDENLEIIVGLLVTTNEERENRLSFAIEKFTEIRILRYFFAHGKLAPHSALRPANDEEYLGASLGFAHELARYAIGQATGGNISSIHICRLK